LPRKWVRLMPISVISQRVMNFLTLYAIACLGHLENRERAIACKSRFHKAGRRWDLLEGAKAEPYPDPEPRFRLIAGLKKALDF
jgi:hypothetical protein